MLPKNYGGVVDTKLRVYGTKNIRVVDMSIIPLNIGAHIQCKHSCQTLLSSTHPSVCSDGLRCWGTSRGYHEKRLVCLMRSSLRPDKTKIWGVGFPLHVYIYIVCTYESEAWF